MPTSFKIDSVIKLGCSMVKMLSGIDTASVESLEMAKENLMTKFDVIGILENLNSLFHK